MSFLFSTQTNEVKQLAKPAFAPQSLLVKRPSRPTKRVPASKPKRKAKGRKSLVSQMGDMTLRDAADLTGAVVRGGLRIATSIFNVEEKVLDNSGNTSYTSAGTVLPVSLMGQGSDYNQRDGLSIRARNLVLNYYGVFNSLGGAAQTLRVMVLQDLENQGSTPSVTNILESASIVAPYLHYVGDRFRVLYDEAQTFTSSAPAKYHRVVCPIDSHVTFKDTTSIASGGWNGQLYLLIISDQASNAPTVNWYSRLSFVDN